MRIVHVSDCYAPRTGGIETQVRSLAAAQAQAGHDVHVITATPGHGSTRSGRDLDGLVTIHRVAARVPAELPIHPRTGHHVRRILATVEPSVVHVHTGVVSPFAWGGMRVAAHMGVPRVVTVHSMWGPLSRTGHTMTQRILPWRGGVVSAVSHAAARPIERSLGIAVSVLPNGIDPNEWPADMGQANPTRLTIVSVLRLAPRKRASALIDVIGESTRRLESDVEVQAVLIGDGPERTRLNRRIESMGLTHVISMAGRQSPPRIREQFQRSDLFVQASVHESFGIAALEARTSGLPVIARSQTGAGEFIESGVNGYLAASDEELVEAVVGVGRDRRLLTRMRTHNATHPPEQTWPHVLAIADGLYRRAGA